MLNILTINKDKQKFQVLNIHSCKFFDKHDDFSICKLPVKEFQQLWRRKSPPFFKIFNSKCCIKDMMCLLNFFLLWKILSSLRGFHYFLTKLTPYCSTQPFLNNFISFFLWRNQCFSFRNFVSRFWNFFEEWYSLIGNSLCWM